MKFGQVAVCHVCGSAALGGGEVDGKVLCGTCLAAVAGFIAHRKAEIEGERHG